MTALDEGQQALLELLRRLQGDAYAFTAITPSSHRRVVARRGDEPAGDVRDLLGWSLPAAEGDFAEIRRLLDRAGLAEPVEPEASEGGSGRWRSGVRVARVAGRLFLHSAFPTDASDAVFLGPDTYRFVRFLQAELAQSDEVARVVDIGAGAGVGGLCCADLLPAARLELTDINPKALRLAAVNAAHAGISADLVLGSGLEAVRPGFDLAIANPPFMAEGSERIYSDGGGMHGSQLSLDWARASLEALAPGGRLLMYTASAILEGGHDPLKAALVAVAQEAGATLVCGEIDPDIFGGVLGAQSYQDVERIAAVGVRLSRGKDATNK